MLQTRLKKSIALLLSMAMVCAGAVALAANIGFTKTGSISIALKDSETQKAIPGAEFTAYQVADATEQGYVFTEEFADCGISIDDLEADGLADHLSAYAQDNALSPITANADETETTTFADLPLGLYLITCGGELDGYYTPSPFLVTVPMLSVDGTEWLYDVDANPKPEVKKKDAETTSLTVEKVWKNDGSAVPKSVSVSLLCDGKTSKTVELNDDNDWTYQWDKLDAGHEWTTTEVKVPDGYTASYTTADGITTITNTIQKKTTTPVDITVKKVWEDEGKSHPSSVSVQLYDGGSASGSAVTLNSSNNWTYTWKDLDSSKTWTVKESSAPSGYVASYSRTGNTVTITNTRTLIKTGQLSWPVPLLAGGGILLFAAGWWMVFGRKREHS